MSVSDVTMTAAAHVTIVRCIVLAPAALIGICFAFKRQDVLDGLQQTNYDVRHRTDDYRIYIAGLIPMTSNVTGDDHVMQGETEAVVLPSIELAIEHVNRDPNVLPGHVLDLAWNDTKVRLVAG